MIQNLIVKLKEFWKILKNIHCPCCGKVSLIPRTREVPCPWGDEYKLLLLCKDCLKKDIESVKVKIFYAWYFELYSNLLEKYFDNPNNKYLSKECDRLETLLFD